MSADAAAINIFAEGGCTCRAVRYRLTAAPMIVNCCHCTWCQRETGSAFVLNAVIESTRLEPTSGHVEKIRTPSLSGRGQLIARCPTCQIALWSHYTSDALSFVRVGTLDVPNLCPPDVHIFVSTKQNWVELPAGIPAFEQFYDPRAFWSATVRERWMAATKPRGGA